MLSYAEHGKFRAQTQALTAHFCTARAAFRPRDPACFALSRAIPDVSEWITALV
jgi:hypothetical protein